MFKKYKVLKWTLLSLGALILIVVGFGWWFISLLPSQKNITDIAVTQPNDLNYITQNVPSSRGKILAVVTSATTMGDTEKSTGYELTELSRAYYVFKANGFDIDIASPRGGEPRVIIDDEDMGIYDYAFLNDSIAQYKTKHTISVADINANDYQAVYFVGGKGAMFDFPDNKAIQSIVRELYQSGGVIGAVCHGPAALVNVTLDNGQHLLKDKRVSGFTNDEELLLIPDAVAIFPFLLQDKLVSQGAKFNEGPMYLEQISKDENMVTGQNPWSTWKVAETMVSQLGYTPKYRKISAEENAIQILKTYQMEGSKKARKKIEKMFVKEKKEIDRILIAKHSMVAAMRGDIGSFFGLVSLTSYAKRVCED